MMEALVQADPRVARMTQLEDLFRMDPNLLEDYFDQERAHQDYEAAISYSRAEGEKRGIKLGREEGEKRGIKLGREEEKFATARRMKAGGMSDPQIAQFTGLPLAAIEAL